MNLSEVNWDFNAAGSWPLAVKIATIVLLSALVAASSFYTFTFNQLNELEQLENTEQALKQAFELKQKKAIKISDYRQQLKQIKISLTEMIRQMPSKAEVVNLLTDISQTGLASGLEFKLFKPEAVVKRDFYSELPINIKVIGKYEELGLFVSGLASLPRIVTIHNIKITPNDSLLIMEVMIKTYYETASKRTADY